mmetsp:Transcript_6607/g.19625  ORF Transcript_6607/g.19625 Transcript_6607/m.19625 type:complete len:374 (-) Transcript_6607:223-1344(-)
MAPPALADIPRDQFVSTVVETVELPAKRPRLGAGDTSREAEWSSRAHMHEYESVANPRMADIPVRFFPASKHESGPTRVERFDLSEEVELPGPATTPNLLAAYVRIDVGDCIQTTANATSSVFFVIRGTGTTTVGKQTVSWKTGDIIATPNDETIIHACTAAEAHGGAALYWISDEPLLNYLGVEPRKRRFEPLHFSAEVMREKVEAIRHASGAQHKNRIGILLSSPATPETKTLTHTLWSLLNVLPCTHPHNVQRPHKHNSVALDLCIYAKPGTCYTLMGREINGEGKIVDPVRCDWESGSTFITPPGWWHSHVNDGDEDAWVLPVQDAGLLTHQRVLDIRFVDEEVQRIKAGFNRGATLKRMHSVKLLMHD